MIKSILVAIDGSPSADSALSISGSLAGIIQADLTGLFVEDVARFQKFSLSAAIGHSLTGEGSGQQLLSPEELATQEELIEAESLKLYQAFQDRCAKVKVRGRFMSVRGVPQEVISERAKTVDFVVVGNDGEHSGVQSKPSGFTVNALLRTVARPVLVVPEEAAGESCMVVAYDGSLTSDRALRAAAEFAEITDTDSLHLLTVANSAEEANALQAPALQYLAPYRVQVTPVCFAGKPEEVITSYVASIDASVLALGAFGSNRLKESIFGSTTEAVLRHAQAAVLLVS